MAMTPFMVEFLVRNVEEESGMYLDRWAVGWKSNHWKSRDSKTLAAAASSAALTSASSNPLAAPLSSSLLHAHESVGAWRREAGLAQMESVMDLGKLMMVMLMIMMMMMMMMMMNPSYRSRNVFLLLLQLQRQSARLCTPSHRHRLRLTRKTGRHASTGASLPEPPAVLSEH